MRAKSRTRKRDEPCGENLHRLAVLIDGGAPHRDDRLVWLGTRRLDAPQLGLDVQLVAGAHRARPLDLAADADHPGRDRYAAGGEAARGEGGGLASPPP